MMKPAQLKALADAMIGPVREFVSRELAKLPKAKSAHDLAAELGCTLPLKEWIASLRGEPGLAGPKGDRGERGEAGPAGAAGAQGPQGAQGPRGEPGAPGERGVAGEPGAQGPMGLHGPAGPVGPSGEPGAEGARGPVGPAGERGADGQPGPRGEKGERGEKGDSGPQGQRGEDGKPGVDGKPGSNGRDAEPVSMEAVRLMVIEETAKAVGALARPADGKDGRDAMEIQVRQGIDFSRSYPAGTYGEALGGVIRAFRQTDPATDAEIASDPGEELPRHGWSVSLNGIFAEHEELSEDGRTLSRRTIYTNGKEFLREIKLKNMIHRDVWKKDGSYEPGDVVTWDGSQWHCFAPTAAQPGTTSDWRLVTRKGRDGKDGKDGAIREVDRETVVKVVTPRGAAG